jgi:hypothetical protein
MAGVPTGIGDVEHHQPAMTASRLQRFCRTLNTLLVCLIMGKTTPVFGCNRKQAYACAIQLKSQTNLQLKYSEGNRQLLFFAPFAINSLLTEKKPFGDRFRRTASTTRKSARTAPGSPRPQSADNLVP